MYYQRGLSLIELMISLALSCFLLLAVTQIYLDNKRHYLYQQNQSGNLENGRFLLMMLEQHLAKAGYKRHPDMEPEAAFLIEDPDDSSDCSFAAGEAMKYLSSSNTLCLRYQPRDEDERDCAGQLPDSNGDTSYLETAYSTTGNAMFTEQFTLENGSLKCNGQDLVTNVADIHFEFGIDTTGQGQITTYTDSPGGNPILGMRYAILMASEQKFLESATDNPACTQWETLTGNNPCEDQRLYRIFGSTLALRNLLP